MTGTAPLTGTAPTSETFSAAVTLRPVDARLLDVAFVATTQPCP